MNETNSFEFYHTKQEYTVMGDIYLRHHIHRNKEAKQIVRGESTKERRTRE